MTPLFPAQRAAEEFDQALGGTATQAVADRYAELLDTVAFLREQPEVTARAEFVGGLRARLMTAAETELIRAPAAVRQLPATRSATSARHRRGAGTLAAALVIVGGSAGMAAAASNALPGEPLYAVKLGVEQARAITRLSQASEGQGLLDQAATRLQEVRSLQAKSDPDPELIAATIKSFRDASEAGADKLFRDYGSTQDTQDIDAVRAFTAQQMAEVASMASALDPQRYGQLTDAADTLADLDQQARVLCGGCSDAPALTPPTALTAAAGALTVDNLLRRPVTQAKLDIDRAAAAKIALLKAAAENDASNIPKIDLSTTTPGAGTADTAPSLPGEQTQVISTLTKDGGLQPAATTGVAVKDLVSGVTTSLTTTVTKTVDGVVTTVVPPTSPLAPLGQGLTGLTDSLGKTVDKTLDKTLGGLAPKK